MHRMVWTAVAALSTVIAAGSAAAEDRNGVQAIAAGDFAGAARVLEAERRIYPDRPELMLNLAVAYTRSGRVADARGLYEAVLGHPPVAMDMPSGMVASSHDVARRGLARLPTALPAVAAR